MDRNVLIARLNHAEPRVIVLRINIFMTPQAGRREVDRLEFAVGARNFQAQLEVHVDHHG